jgi:hypothetical protein
MTRIPSNTHLLALLREQAVALQRQRPAPETKLAARIDPKPASGRPDQWLALVAQQIATLPADDPLRRRKAFRAFLEAGLARELGIENIGSAEFQHLVAIVQDGMLADPKISEAIDRAGDLLLSAAAHPG